jgi:hypothetical protein
LLHHIWRGLGELPLYPEEKIGIEITGEDDNRKITLNVRHQYYYPPAHNGH